MFRKLKPSGGVEEHVTAMNHVETRNVNQMLNIHYNHHKRFRKIDYYLFRRVRIILCILEAFVDHTWL